MSKPVKELVRKELAKRFEGTTSLAVVGFTGLDGVTTVSLRSRLRQKNIRMTVVKNAVARQAFKELGLDVAAQALEGPCAVVYGGDSVIDVVRELLDAKKDAPSLTVKAAVLEGELFGADRVEELSKFPTRPEAIAQVVGLVLSPGKRLAACLVGPGSRIAGILKSLEEKHQQAEGGAEAPQASEAPAATA